MKLNIFKITLIISLFLSNQSHGQTYLQQFGLPINGEAADDRSGKSISNSNDGYTVAIGAYFNDANGSNSGHVRVYQWNNGTWTQKGSDINGESTEDWSGFAVSISANGNVVAIGAPNNDGNGLNSGHVRVYSWVSNAWVQLGTDINGEAASDVFGGAVSLSDDGLTLAVGAPSNDGNGADAGHVRVFAWNGTAWIQKGSDINGENTSDSSGESVSLNEDGSILAIGATQNDGNGSNAGHARVFSWNGSAWIQLGTDIDGSGAGNFCGKSLQLNDVGNRFVVGAPFHASLLGHIRIFQWNGIAWLQVGSDILGQDANEQFGVSSAISADGNTVLSGAFGNSNAGTNAGTARAYTWNGTIWQQVGNDLDGVAAGDQCGTSVSISGNSNVMSVASYLNSTIGSTAGHVRNWNICQVANSIDTHVECNAYTWINGVTYTSNNNNATFTYPGASVSGCDSVVTLNLTILPLSQSTYAVTSCGSYTWLNGISYTSSNNTATFTYSGASSSGCDSIVTLNLTILPVVQVTDAIVSCTPITWIDGNTYNSSNNTASFTYVGGASNGCDSIVLLNLTINSVTDNTISSSGATITANNDFSSYVWLDCNNNFSIISGQTNQSFTPTANGNYAVQLTQNGCVDTSACVSISSVGLIEVNFENEVNFYPNPTKENFKIECLNCIQKDFSVVSAEGKVVLKGKLENGQAIIDASKFKKGIYFVEVAHEKGVVYSTKLVVE